MTFIPAPDIVASVDLGSNALRSMIVEIRPGGGFLVRDDLRFPIRLGEGLGERARILPVAVRRLRRAAEILRAVFEQYRVGSVVAVGTSALRRASNAPAILEMLLRDYGIPVRVVPAHEEAALAFLSARHLRSKQGFVAMLDVGGGSTEFAMGTGNIPSWAVSLGTGAVSATERYLRSDPPGSEELALLAGQTEKLLRKELSALPLAGRVPALVGIGGTVTTVAAWLSGQGCHRPDGAGGLSLAYGQISSAYDRLSRMTTRRRIHSGISPEKADVIVAGLGILLSCLRYLGTRKVLVDGGGIRRGLILALLAGKYTGKGRSR